MRFDHILQLRPDSPKISLESLYGSFDLRVHDLAKFRFHFLLKIALPIIATPNHVHRCPERQFVFKKALSLGGAVTTRLIDPADETMDLPQGLFLACLNKTHKPIEPLFVVSDSAKRLTHFRSDFFQTQLRRLPG